MSPLKRTGRAKAKERAGRHRKPDPEQLRGGPYPIARTPVAQLLLNPHAPNADVPPELAERDYDFPAVELPDERPLVSAGELLAVLDDDDTQPLAGVVVDDTPQPAHHEGLALVPVPSLPFLNAGAPDPRPEPESAPWLHVGNALPARLTDLELTMHGLPVPPDAPAAPSLPPAPQPYRPIRRDARHPLVFSSFDVEFWEVIRDVVRQQEAGPASLRMSNDEAMDKLMAHLGRAESAHKAGIGRVAAHEYAGHLAESSRPLPRRVPGATLEASRGQLVAS